MLKIVIIGAGPAGLGAAYRLKELGYENFIVYEKNNYAGGLCASFIDEKRFVWDLGGHVIFSHYEYYDKLLKDMLGGDYLSHRRSAWIRTIGRWVPYPFQNNSKYLPGDIIKDCLNGLEEADKRKSSPANFQDWIVYAMGEGIAKYFMLPYNSKVWAYPLTDLSLDWISERVSPVDLKEVSELLISGKDKTDWGKNAAFRFPLFGGTGEIFRRIAGLLSNKIVFNTELTEVDAASKKIYLSGGKEDTYDILINTSPLDRLLSLIKGRDSDLAGAALGLKHNSLFVVGLGINRPCVSDKCWIYFPDNNAPFFRCTYFSNYSPNNVPDSKKCYSLLCETAYSEYKKEMKEGIVEKTIQGLIDSGILDKSEKDFIITKFLFDIEYAYPIPTINRNDILRKVQPQLENLGIYSRGRFGAWKYETGNTDHSVMQGKEVVDKILGLGEEIVHRC